MSPINYTAKNNLLDAHLIPPSSLDDVPGGNACSIIRGVRAILL
jgi:hypothetical protein